MDRLVFYVAGELPAQTQYPAVLLEPDGWDDYGMHTQFQLSVALAAGEPTVPIGAVKVLARDYPEPPPDAGFHTKTRTVDVIDATFERLPSEAFCSLGQSPDYYARLGRFMPGSGLGIEILRRIGDVCWRTDAAWWDDDPAFASSLLRFTGANIARRDAKIVFAGNTPQTEIVNSIPLSSLSVPVIRARPRNLQFVFDGRLPVPGRTHVIVGRNGAGKTQLLNDIAEWLATDMSRSQEKFRFAPSFSRVVYVSTNAFNKAPEVRAGRGQSFVYLGFLPVERALATAVHSLPETIPDAEWNTTLQKMFPSPQRLKDAVPFLEDSLERDLVHLQGDDGWRKWAVSAFGGDSLACAIIESPARNLPRLSAGQQSLLTLFAGLFRHLNRGALLLVDEPENYLHPSLLASFVRHLSDLLDARSAFALLTTHSPIVVQETPTKFVWVMDRNGDENHFMNPPFETFGETVDNIDEYLFNTDFNSSRWKKTLSGFVQEGRSNDEIRSAVGGAELSLLARTYIESERLRIGRGRGSD